jgi:hypothetical protein
LTQEDLDGILEALALEDGPHEDLPRTSIENYIRGCADAEEETRVESAMAASSAIREEILALVAVAKRGEEFAALVAPPPPPRRRAYGQIVHDNRRRPWMLRRSAVLAYCGLLALALVWVLSPLPPSLHKEPLPLYAVSLDRRLTDEQFEPMLERAPGDVQPLHGARNLRDAALLSFFQAIEWKDEKFEIHPVPPPGGGRRPYDLHLELHRGEAIVPWRYHVLLPQDAEEPRTAILVFPDLSLYWVDSNTWKGRAEFSQRPGQSLFLAVAYRIGEQQYHATPPVRIPPP